MCLDVAVKRGAECNADHQFVCVKIRLAGGCYRRKAMAGSDGRRYDASKLVSDGRAEYGSNHALRLEFQKLVAERAGAAWPTEGGVDEKWTAVSGTQVFQSRTKFMREIHMVVCGFLLPPPPPPQLNILSVIKQCSTTSW